MDKIPLLATLENSNGAQKHSILSFPLKSWVSALTEMTQSKIEN